MSPPRAPADSDRCVVVGAGPGGMLLGYLLALAEIPVTVLEARPDFNRDFRGDSLHPYTLELLDQLGLVDELLTDNEHYPARRFRFHTPRGTVTTADYGKLKTRFNYVALMPQSHFLEFLARKAERLPAFELVRSAKVTGLLQGDRVEGVRYRDHRGEHELGASLVVGTDGRFSKVRHLAEMSASPLGATTDLLWFRLPRRGTDPAGAEVDLYFGSQHYVGLLKRPQDWQVGYTVPKGGYAAAREAGAEPIRRFVATHVPWLRDRVSLLEDFSQVTLLSVEIARVRHWHRPGLLLLGDAAHVISPVGGNGILMAIQDAVAAANHLIPRLRAGPPASADLAAVQQDREPGIAQVQHQQVQIEQRLATAREADRPITPPAWLPLVTALPSARRRAARRNAYGPRPPHFDTALVSHVGSR